MRCRPASAASSASCDLLRKILDDARNRIGRRLAETADRRVRHRLRKLAQQRHVPRWLREERNGLLGADPAWRALAARFVGEEMHEIPCRIARAVTLRQHD